MRLILAMAWRNLWRHKRRTVLTILAVFFATFFTAAMRGLAVGTWESNIRNTLEVFSGYLQVQREGFQDSPSLRKNFPYPGAAGPSIRALPVVTGSAPRIMTDGLISFRDNSSGAVIIGVDPAAEERLARFPARVNRGKFFDAGDVRSVVLGHRLLDNIRASVGDTLVVLAQGFDGVLGNQLYRICGTVKLGSMEFDRMGVFMHLRAAQELLAMEGRVNIVALGVRRLADIPEVRDSLAASLDRTEARGVVVLTWEEVLPELTQAMELDMIGDWFFLGVLIVIVTFGILNTVLMSVTERFREFGVSLAIGMPPRSLVFLVFVETAFMSLIGIVLGAGAGNLLNRYFAHNPIELTGDMGAMYEEYGFIPQIISSPDIGIVVNVAVIMLLVSFLSTLYPVFRVARLEPLKGIRYT